MTDLLTVFALVGMVITLSALASGVVERTPLSFPMIFLALGALLGEAGLGVLSIAPEDPTLEAIAVLNLSLVLFLDALKLRFDGGRREWLVPALALGPGTLLVIALTAFAAWALVGATPLEALLFGAILSSTDPIVLRDVIRDERIPRSVRRALSIEAGTNDLVVLPILLLLIALSLGRLGGASEWAAFLGRVFLIGPLAGLAVGASGAWLARWVDRRIGIRREYQTLYGIGVVLVSYAAAEGLGGDGFLASFAAGLAITALNLDLCDCFLEYGEATAEMAMLLGFVLFGAVLSVLVTRAPALPSLAFAALVIGVVRPLALGLVLSRARLSRSALAFIAWFGPRGLNSLLFTLLVLRSGVPGAEGLLAVVGVVVMASVALHGTSATPLSAWYARVVARRTLPEERESTAAGLFDAAAHDDVPRIGPDELARRLGSADPPLVLDLRGRAAFEQDPVRIPG
ncbi:MAG: cation:proton antiporter, partial [Candidatus Binatia bacterium]